MEWLNTKKKITNKRKMAKWIRWCNTKLTNSFLLCFILIIFFFVFVIRNSSDLIKKKYCNANGVTELVKYSMNNDHQTKRPIIFVRNMKILLLALLLLLVSCVCHCRKKKIAKIFSILMNFNERIFQSKEREGEREKKSGKNINVKHSIPFHFVAFMNAEWI